MKKIVASMALFWLVSCSSTLDCITGDSPVWESRTLSEGMRFQPYGESIRLNGGGAFEILDFRIQGDLPNGLNAEFDGSVLLISGTPRELGTFPIKAVVRVAGEDPDGTAGSCEQTISKSYQIRIN